MHCAPPVGCAPDSRELERVYAHAALTKSDHSLVPIRPHYTPQPNELITDDPDDIFLMAEVFTEAAGRPLNVDVAGWVRHEKEHAEASHAIGGTDQLYIFRIHTRIRNNGSGSEKIFVAQPFHYWSALPVYNIREASVYARPMDPSPYDIHLLRLAGYRSIEELDRRIVAWRQENPEAPLLRPLSCLFKPEPLTPV